MSNGKGSNRRQFNKKLERSYKAGHTGTFGEHEKVDGRRTKKVVVNGQLVDKPGGDLHIIPIEGTPNEYFEHLGRLEEQARSYFARTLPVSAEVLGVK
jgi:hypothetical protein